MNLVLRTLRKYVLEQAKSENKYALEFCKGFLVKDLLGDGTVLLGRHTLEVVLSEVDTEAQQDLRGMFKLFGIITSVFRNRIDVSTDFDSCSWLIENKAFVGHYKNRIRLVNYFLTNYYIKTLYRRLKSVENFGILIRDFANKNSIPYSTAEMYLFRNMKRGFFKTTKHKNKTIYLLTEHAHNFMKFFDYLVEEIQTSYPLQFPIGKNRVTRLDIPDKCTASMTDSKSL